MGIEDRLTYREIARAHERRHMERELLAGASAGGNGLYAAELIAKGRRTYAARYDAALITGTLDHWDRKTARTALYWFQITGNRLLAVMACLLVCVAAFAVASTHNSLSAALLHFFAMTVGAGVLIIPLWLWTRANARRDLDQVLARAEARS